MRLVLELLKLDGWSLDVLSTRSMPMRKCIAEACIGLDKMLTVTMTVAWICWKRASRQLNTAWIGHYVAVARDGQMAPCTLF